MDKQPCLDALTQNGIDNEDVPFLSEVLIAFRGDFPRAMESLSRNGQRWVVMFRSFGETDPQCLFISMVNHIVCLHCSEGLSGKTTESQYQALGLQNVEQLSPQSIRAGVAAIAQDYRSVLYDSVGTVEIDNGAVTLGIFDPMTYTYRAVTLQGFTGATQPPS